MKDGIELHHGKSNDFSYDSCEFIHYCSLIVKHAHMLPLSSFLRRHVLKQLKTSCFHHNFPFRLSLIGQESNSVFIRSEWYYSFEWTILVLINGLCCSFFEASEILSKIHGA